MSSSTQARSLGDTQFRKTPASQQQQNVLSSSSPTIQLTENRTTLATSQSVATNVSPLPQMNSLGSIIGLLLSPSLSSAAASSSSILASEYTHIPIEILNCVFNNSIKKRFHIFTLSVTAISFN